MLAVVREAECIGCTKCIQACPVDAILGGAKQMHTVIADECTGCELCVEPCPVDCIDMVIVSEPSSDVDQKQRADIARERFHARDKRLKSQQRDKQSAQSVVNKKNYIQEAIARAKAKKAHKSSY